MPRWLRWALVRAMKSSSQRSPSSRAQTASSITAARRCSRSRTDTLLIDPADVARKITPRTKAIMAVDYAGQPCDYAALRAIAERHGLQIVADACHALGADEGTSVGSLADLSTFSFHPVKPITTGEGGAITTHDAELAAKMRVFRGHGIVSDFRQREKQGSWAYEMTSLGYNFRLSDIQCALGLSQLAKLPALIDRRQADRRALRGRRLRDQPRSHATRPAAGRLARLSSLRHPTRRRPRSRRGLPRAARRGDRRQRPLPAGVSAPVLSRTLRR